MNKRIVLTTASAIAVVAAGLTVYFNHSNNHPSTDDAYVHAYTITVSPYVEGYIKSIHAEPNAFVRKGQLLYEITPLPFQLNVAEQQHKLEAAKAQKAVLNKEILQARQALKDRKASLWLISTNQERYAFLLSKQVVALEQEQEQQAAKLEAEAKAKEADLEISRLQQQIHQQESIIRSLQSTVNKAKVDLNYTRYYAPIDAYVSNNFTIRSGQYVKPGQAMFKLMDNTKWWVDANYLESQIHRIREGMKAKIKLDMYPGVTFEGRVINISQGSGAYFSLLPPQNASGNWVKVPQRFPVRIQLEQNSQNPLRAGASARATINTLR